MSRVLRWLLLGLAVLTLLLGMAWSWLFHSAPGRDFVLARAQAALGDERLRWGAIGGTIGGGLTLDQALLRLDTLQVEARQIVVTIRPASAWRGRLRVESLAIAGLRLTPLRRSAPAAEPAWTVPSELPPLPLPLRIEIAQLQVRELAWLGNPEAPLRAHELSAALMLSDRRVTLHALHLTTARGSARGEAELTLGTGSALDARLALTATVADGTPWHAQVSVAGTPSALTLRVVGNAPGEFSLAGEWHAQRDHWRWQAQLRAQGIAPAALGGPRGNFGGELTVDGVDASATLSGFLQRDAQTLAIAPSTLSWQSPRLLLLLSPLQLGVAGGQTRIVGEIDLGESGPRVALQMQAADLRWGDDAQPTRASGDARVEGWIDAWSVDAQAQLARAGLTAQLRLLADGDAQHAQLHELSLRTPAGRSQLDGEVRFAEALQWQLQGRLSGLDPGWFVADYPGALAAPISTHGDVRDGAIEAHASLDELSGSVRQRKVSGSARIDWRGDATTADVDLHVGASHVRVVGQLDTHVDARIGLMPLQLADLLPGAQGQLRGELLLRGPRALPLPSGDLQGHALVWGDFRARALRLRAQARGQGDTRAQLQASELAIDGFDIARLDVELDGRPEQARLTLSAVSEALHAELTGNWAQHGAQRAFSLHSLRLAPAQGAPWQLRQPVRLVGAAIWHLPPLCLDSDDGEVCAEGTWPGSIALHARALDLALAQPWLHRDDAQFALSGTLDVDASLRGGGSSPLLGNAQVRGGAGSLQLLPATRAPAFAWHALNVKAQLDAVRASAHLRLESDADRRLDGRIDMTRTGDGALDGELNVDVAQLAWLELFSPDLAAPSGRLHGRFDIGGSRAAPRVSGQLSLQPFAAELPALGLTLRDSSAHLNAAADGMLTLSALLNTGDGTLKVDGESAVGANAPLTLRLDGERVKVSDTADVTAWISPALTVQRADGVLSVRGRVDVPQARIALDKRERRAAARSADVEVIDPLEPESAGAALPLALDLDLQIGKDVRLSGFGLEGKLGGGLRVTQNPGREPLGTGTVTATGSYQRYGKPLEIRHARLTYTRSPLDDPALDIRAQRTVDAQMVGVQIDGTAQRPLTTLISDPALENGETLSWLVLGRPLRAAKQDDSARLDAAAMALGAGGNLLAEQLGARLGLDQAGVAESRALGANTLTVGKNLSPRLYLSYGVSLIGSGQVVALKYLLGGGFDLEIESGIESRGSINWRTER